MVFGLAGWRCRCVFEVGLVQQRDKKISSVQPRQTLPLLDLVHSYCGPSKERIFVFELNEVARNIETTCGLIKIMYYSRNVVIY